MTPSTRASCRGTLPRPCPIWVGEAIGLWRSLPPSPLTAIILLLQTVLLTKHATPVTAGHIHAQVAASYKVGSGNISVDVSFTGK